MRSYVLVIDSFKGCLTSLEAEAVVSETICRADPLAEVVSVPVSDGGEGMLDAFLAVMGGERVSPGEGSAGVPDHCFIRCHEGAGGAH